MTTAEHTPLLLRIKTVSAPFDADRVVELKLDVEGPYDVRGELYLRVPAEDAKHWLPGDLLGALLRRL
jgi:hypothetical protein